MARGRPVGRVRGLILLLAAACIGVELVSALTGWYREAAVPLLPVGTLDAGLFLVMDGRRWY